MPTTMNHRISRTLSVIALFASLKTAGAFTLGFSDKQLFLDLTKSSDATGELPNLGYRGYQATTLGGITLLPVQVGGHGLHVGGLVVSPQYDWTSLLAGHDICLDGSEDIDVSFAPCHAFGFDIAEPNGYNYGEFVESKFTITLFSNGEQIGQVTYEPPNGVSAFVGVWSDTRFDRVSIRETIGGGEDEYFGHFYTDHKTNPNARVPIAGLWNTGFNVNGARLANGAVDPHFKAYMGSDMSQWQASNPSWAWLANSDLSAWITPTGNGNDTHPAGIYDLEQTVDLSGFDPATVVVEGRWLADNAAELVLNGVTTGISLGEGHFSNWGQFKVESGFRYGQNSLRFRVSNYSSSGINPVGLRVEFTSVSGAPASNLSQRKFLIDPSATYLRVSGDPDAKDAKPIDLAANNLRPGDLVLLERRGLYGFAPAIPQDYTGVQMIGVFSRNSTLDENPGTPPLRVPGRTASSAQSFATPETYFGDHTTDIESDFYISQVLVRIPADATHLFVSSNDVFFGDNITHPTDPLRLSVTKISDPNHDSDGDGCSDLCEILTGTSPGDSSSVFRQTPSFNGVFSTQLAGLAGRRYVLERSANLAGGVWTEVAATGPLAADLPVTLADPDPVPPPAAFYRIAISMP
ncbi:MAG: hypothetical protein J0M04_03105 [Verrucomicrobia bacterium]|nr:hypothetical protein [Verrucomicrobiota bacterium]